MHRWLMLLTLLMVLSIASSAYPLPDTVALQLVHDLQEDWLVYEIDQAAYVPYLADRHESRSLHFFLHPSFRPYYMALYTPHAASLWLHGRLFDTLPAASWYLIPCQQLWQMAGQDTALFVSLFSAQGLKQLQSWIVQPSASGSAGTQESIEPTYTPASGQAKLVEYKSRQTHHVLEKLRNWAVVLVLLAVSTYILIRAIAPKSIAYTWHITWHAPPQDKEYTQSYSVFSVKWMLHLLWLALWVALSWWLGLGIGQPHKDAAGFLQHPLLLYGQIYVWVVLLLLFKWILCQLAAAALLLPEMPRLHFFRFLQLLQWVAILVVLVQLLAVLYYRTELLRLYQSLFFQLALILLSFWVIRQLMTSAKLPALRSFLYFCSTEVIPLFFLLKAVRV